MAYISLEHNPKGAGIFGKPYFARFNPSTGNYGVEEASSSYNHFEGCVGFIVKQYFERIAKARTGSIPFELRLKGDFTSPQKKLLEDLVESYNSVATSFLVK